jgi:hypothetical protein
MTPEMSITAMELPLPKVVVVLSPPFMFLTAYVTRRPTPSRATARIPTMIAIQNQPERRGGPEYP